MQLTLEQFLEQEREKLKQFEAYWKRNAKKEPETFPSSLMAGDWDEMLAEFDGNE
ncbi:hypothetical protein [Photobacterium leiognathi]|uniref:hypothetical protein n=1 Tax=Photobacterium leiognathi TaxID=553611 RepID=UPI002982A2E6|nr:hypothetical protein [Photobacterium leiognathi]